jgi:hypothetical protein
VSGSPEFSDISDESASASRNSLSRTVSLEALAAALPNIPDAVKTKDNTPTYSAGVLGYNDPGPLPDCLREYGSDPNKQLDPLHSCNYCPHVTGMRQRMRESDLRTIKFILLYNFFPARLKIDIWKMWFDSEYELEGEHRINLDYKPPKLLALSRHHRQKCAYWYYEGGFGGQSFFTFDNERVLLKWLRSLAPSVIKTLNDVRMVYFVTVDEKKPSSGNRYESLSSAQDMKSAKHGVLIEVLVDMEQKNFALNTLSVELHVTDVTKATNPSERAACEVQKLIFGPQQAREAYDSRDSRPRSARVRS